MNLGIDIIEIPRIREACQRYGDRFIRKVLTEKEASYCLSKKNPFESIAVRFAAKEAFSKAIGTGITEHFGWHSVEILRDDSGKPVINFFSPLTHLDPEKVRVSLSHTHKYAIAAVIILP
ncbi:MAG: holo-ACP synthase [Chloroherpetonaceae bacterium]|nr:holo-ACP synthase [Chloroherpetonaceae bacterium]